MKGCKKSPRWKNVHHHQRGRWKAGEREKGFLLGRGKGKWTGREKENHQGEDTSLHLLEVLGEPTVLPVCATTGRGSQICVTGTVIENRNETNLKINAGFLEEIVMLALAVLVVHLGDVNGTVLAEVGGIQEMRGMKEVIGGAGIRGGVESKTGTGIVRESVIEIEIVTGTGQGVDMTTIAGGQEMKTTEEAGMEGEDGEEEEEIGQEKREVGVVVTVTSGGEGEGIVTLTGNGTMIVSKSRTETGMVGGLVGVIATVTVIKVTAGGVEETVTAIKSVIEEGGTGIGIKIESEIVTVAGEVETEIEIEVGEIVME